MLYVLKLVITREVRNTQRRFRITGQLFLTPVHSGYSNIKHIDMNLGNFTIKAAEAFQQAQQLAFNSQNPNIETEHILKALIDQEDSPVDYLLKKNNVTLNLVESKLMN